MLISACIQEALEIKGSNSPLKSKGVVSSIEYQYDRILKKRDNGFICDEGMSAFCTTVISEMELDHVELVDPLWAQRVLRGDLSTEKIPTQFQKGFLVYVPVVDTLHW
jgi:hypothetical protein